MRGITKRFSPASLANDAIDFDVAPGEVHALLGENGAGKSTLMQILYGMLRPDAGTIRVGGGVVAFASPRDAITAGIGMVHQEFMLVDSFTVAQNAAMGRAGAFDLRATARRLSELARRFGLGVDCDARVRDLAVGVRQRVEILKLLDREARLLILDEPTAVLTPQEVAGLLDVLRALRAAGCGVVLITHKLREVLAVADRVTVLRDGRVAGRVAVRDTDERSLARLMVGRDTGPRIAKAPAVPPASPPVLWVENLDVAGRPGVRGVSFEVAAGEVLGIAGVDGNGQSELVEALFGLRPATGGRVALAGQDVTTWSPARRRAAGLGYLPADRRHVASVPELSLADNAILGAHRKFSRGGGWLRDRVAAAAHARALAARFGVRAPGPHFAAGKLSGGNLQKLVLGREVEREPRALLVEQPTRGIDLGAVEAVWAELLALRAAGCAIVLVSAELEELLSLSDRIAVMFAGRLVGIVPAARADVAAIGLMMAGREPASLAA